MSNEKYDYDTQLKRLRLYAYRIAEMVADKDKQYGSSWRKRGGPGAFMVIARKWDRIEQACQRADNQYDIFSCFASEGRTEGIGDDVIDLIGYLLVLLEYTGNVGSLHRIGDKPIIDDSYFLDLDDDKKDPDEE